MRNKMDGKRTTQETGTESNEEKQNTSMCKEAVNTRKASLQFKIALIQKLPGKCDGTRGCLQVRNADSSHEHQTWVS